MEQPSWLRDPPSGLTTMNTENLLARITSSPDICHGKPCVRGLRYPVETLIELLSSGMTHEEILSDYVDLEKRRPCGSPRLCATPILRWRNHLGCAKCLFSQNLIPSLNPIQFPSFSLVRP